MKILLVTIQQSNNYGAMLQAYATVEVLSQYGQVNTLNYNNKFLEEQLSLIRFSLQKAGLKKVAHDLLRLPYRIVAIKKMKKFQKKMFLTQKITQEDLKLKKDMFSNFDIYVCGSDQIWNPKIVSIHGIIDPVYFLSFAPIGKQKISFASSMGSHTYSTLESKEVSSLLKGFNMISLREQDGVEKIRHILPEKEIHRFLDPTLLLEKSEWLDLLNVVEVNSLKKYILIYSVMKSPLINELVSYYKEKCKLDVIVLDQSLFSFVKADKHIKSAGPNDFIKLMLNASLVITDSFHGACFSLNFGKEFVVASPGIKVNRIKNLLDIVELNDKIVYSSDDIGKVKSSYDNEKVKSRLAEIRAKVLAKLSDNMAKSN